MTPYRMVTVYRTFRRNVVIVYVTTYFLVFSSSLFAVYIAVYIAVFPIAHL
jgi:MFS superfamily sulfate permease-like transporter